VTLRLIDAPSVAERSTLSALRFQDNRAVLHRDPSFMPVRRSAWSAWVIRDDGVVPQAPVGVTYWMNRLQNIPETDPMFVTLNPARPLRDEMIYDETVFRHPVFDQAAITAQASIAGLQGLNRSWFAGAWLRNGFHEDGFVSAVRIARRLLPERAWQ
jgi:predicted NAD/FAD-binding protein